MEKGYQHKQYIDSLNDLGRPLRLENAKGWLLTRSIEDTDYLDLAGPYPFLCCGNWKALHDEITALNDGFVSMACVLDPYGHYTSKEIAAIFPDVCMPYKIHYYVDLQRYNDKDIAENHRRNARKASKLIHIEKVREPQRVIDDWCRLYDDLIRKHSIRGIAQFSRRAFKHQLAVPDACIFKAVYTNTTIGMVLFYFQNDDVHYHLAAYNDTGYQCCASFGIFYEAIRYFKSLGLRYLCLGGAADAKDKSEDGLTRFKRGWATGKRTAWFGGRVFNRQIYQKIVQRKGLMGNSFFPAYRTCL